MLLLPSLILLGLVSPLSLEVIITRFFCLRFICLLFLLVPLVGTLIVRIELGFPWTPKFLPPHASFTSVDAALEVFNGLILDAANNSIPRDSSVSRAKKHTYHHWLRSRSRAGWIEHKRASAVARCTLRYASRSY